MRIFLSCIFFITSYSLFSVHIVNQTNQQLRTRVTTETKTFIIDLRPNQSYFVSERPNHLTLYMPSGSCSTFYNIGMNQTIFDRLLIRIQRGNPNCLVIGYSGKTRQAAPVNIPAIVFEPDSCKRRCWNPTSGQVFSEFYITPQAATIQY